MQRTDFAADAEQERQAQHDKRQRGAVRQQQLDKYTAQGKQRAADGQPFKETLMELIQAGDVTAGGHQREQQPLLQTVEH